MPHASARFPLWPALLAGLVFVAVGVLPKLWAGHPVRWTAVAISAMVAVIPYFAAVYLIQARRSGRYVWQFSLRTTFWGATYFCVLVGLSRTEQRTAHISRPAWQKIESSLFAIIGSGTARTGNESLVQVQRRTFGDVDLRRLVELHPLMCEHHCPLTVLDLANTRVTDAGMAMLTAVDTLKFCCFDGTAVTDACVAQFATGLPSLQVVSFVSTAVTDGELRRLATARPELNIEPKSYLVDSSHERSPTRSPSTEL